MLLKYFYDQALAHASYLVGCQRANEAVVIDPGRDIERYLQAANREGMRLVSVAETHIHADYVSGARELAERVGAKLHVSDEGPAEWKYQYAPNYDAQLLREGDTFAVGNIDFAVLHTPGHTPESLSFLVTDRGGGADKPMGIFTGDFVFVGSIGRPDLLEEAAGVRGSAKEGAHALFRSAQRFKTLPDYLQVWPAHGAGSACGKGLGAIPSSTVGYEKMYNPALQFTEENEFVRYILEDQPEAPKYFALMKRVNKEGPAILGEVKLPEYLDEQGIAKVATEATVIDLSPSDQFAGGHVPGSINIPLPMLATWAGWIVDYSKPVYLVCEPDQLREATRVLRKIGLDRIEGIYDSEDVRAAGLATQSYRSATPSELVDRIEAGEVSLIDVRSASEWADSHVAQADHKFLGRLPQTSASLERDRIVVTQCRSGARSAIGASLLQARGFDVINMTGGFDAWQNENLPVVSPDTDQPQPCDATASSCS